MKIIQITAIMMLLAAALLTGCRNRPSTTMPGTIPTTRPQQTTPSTRPSTAPTTTPMPSVTMPSGTDSTPATNGTDGILNPDDGMARGRGMRRY